MVFTLIYLDIGGLAEPIRLAFKVGLIEFIDRRVTYDEIAQMRAAGYLPNSQVPVLQLDDGSVHGQANAILRYVGKLAGLYPDEYQLRIESALETIADIHKSLIPLWYSHTIGRSPSDGQFLPGTELTPEQQAATLAAVEGVILPARLSQLNRLVMVGGMTGPFICGELPSIADISLCVLVKGLEMGTLCDGLHLHLSDAHGAGAGADLYPNINKMIEKLQELPGMAAYTWSR